MTSQKLSRQADINSDKTRSVAFKTACNIMSKWHCTKEQMYTILKISRSAFYKYADCPDKARLTDDQIERISYILNIHQALRVLFSNPDNVYGFMTLKNNNEFFNGKAPIEIIASGNFGALYEVYKRIDALRGGQW